MSVRLGEDAAIVLEGDCPAADAETLLRQLAGRPDAPVDWRGCSSAHLAVVQVLMAAKPRLVGPPRGAFLRDFVQPSLARIG